jgi:hypothetical protein
VAHGADPAVQEICPEASVFTIPRDRFNGFDSWRGTLLNSFQQGLAQTYDRVIRTDADELICLDPDHWGSFQELFAAHPSRALFALGFDLFDLASAEAEVAADQSTGGAAAAMAAPGVFETCDQAVFSGHYSKAWAGRGGAAFQRHGVSLRPPKVAGFAFDLPRGVYLAHLKFADCRALMRANAVRKEVARSGGQGLPGPAWAKPDRRAAQRFLQVAAMEAGDWQAEADQAWQALQEPVRSLEPPVVRCKSLQFDKRVTLPAWFRG